MTEDSDHKRVPSFSGKQQAEGQSILDKEALVNKSSVQELIGLGIIYQKKGLLEEAKQAYQQAINLEPECVEGHINLGNILLFQGKRLAAEQAYQQALQFNPNLFHVCRNLGDLYVHLRLDEHAKYWYKRAFFLRQQDELLLKKTLIFPSFVNSESEITQGFKAFDKGLEYLLKKNLHVTCAIEEMNYSPFFLHYYGVDNKRRMERLALLFRQNLTALSEPPKRLNQVKKKKKVGILSRYLYNHSIGRFFAGLLEQLNPDLMDFVAITFPSPQDSLIAKIRNKMPLICLPYEFETASQCILEENLDILLYLEIGLDPLTYFLAFRRLAPIQCMTWGHGETSGLSTVDYFISCQGRETDVSQQYYTEQLICMENITTYFEKPTQASSLKTRQELGLPHGNLYICPQSLFKIHPRFDHLLNRILAEDQAGHLLLLDYHIEHYTKKFKQRLSNLMGEQMKRVHFLARRPPEAFLNLIAVSDVMLDPLYAGGGMTTIEAFSTGIPIVTCPTAQASSRMTLACYQSMGIDDCVVDSPENYVKKVVQLGTDPTYRQLIKNKILNRHEVLYRNEKAVREFENILLALKIRD